MQILLANNYCYTESNHYKRFERVRSINNNFDYTSDTTAPSLSEKELTAMCMTVSEKSLAHDWENEDDERWNIFLNE